MSTYSINFATDTSVFLPKEFEKFQNLALEACVKQIDDVCHALRISSGKINLTFYQLY